MIYLGIGANLPSKEFATPKETLQAALKSLGRLGVESVALSRWFESAPVPASSQPWYINAVVQVETALEPGALLSVLHDVEAAYGRVRGEVNAARVIDLDLLDYRGQCSKMDDAVVLPHPRMTERAFVLRPLHDIAPDWRHPVTDRSIEELIAALDPAQECRPMT